MNNKIILRLLGIVGIILLVPFIAMQFTDEVKWGPADFIVAGLLLFGVGLLIELVSKKITSPRFKAIVIVAIVLIFLLLWAELAVGVFNSAIAGD